MLSCQLKGGGGAEVLESLREVGDVQMYMGHCDFD